MLLFQSLPFYGLEKISLVEIGSLQIVFIYTHMVIKEIMEMQEWRICVYILGNFFFLINVWLFCVHCIIWDQAIKLVNLGINLWQWS